MRRIALTLRQSQQLVCVIKMAGQASGSIIRRCCPAGIPPDQVVSDDVGHTRIKVLQQLQCRLREEECACIAKQHPLVASVIHYLLSRKHCYQLDPVRHTAAKSEDSEAALFKSSRYLECCCFQVPVMCIRSNRWRYNGKALV